MPRFSPRFSPRLTLSTAVLGLAALGMSACGPSVGSDSAAGADVDFTGVEPAESITFWSNHPGGSMEIEEEIIAGFTEESGIEVQLVTAGANYEEVSQRFQTAQTSDDVGDMVVVSDATWFTNFANDSLLPVDQALEAAGADTSTYQETLYDDYLYDDAHYAVPYARSTPIFYYNKDQYAEAGLEDRAPATWDEVKANSEQL
ncbi:extracellular solute-binding protein, partial [Nocardia sp. NPDC059091]